MDSIRLLKKKEIFKKGKKEKRKERKKIHQSLDLFLKISLQKANK